MRTHLLLVFLLLFLGCVSVDVEEFDVVKEIVAPDVEGYRVQEVAVEVFEHPLTVDEVVEIALRRHPLLAASYSDVSAADADVLKALSNFLPKVEVSGIYHRRDNRMGMKTTFNPADFGLPGPPVEMKMYMGERETTMFKAEMRLPIYTFGMNSALFRQAHHNLAATRYGSLSVKQSVVRDAKLAYAAVIRAERLLSSARKRLEALKSHRKRLASLLERGMVVRADLLQMDVAVAEAESGVLAASRGVKLARMRLASCMGVSVDTEVELVEELPISELKTDVTQLVQESLKQNPELRGMHHTLCALREALKAVKAQRYPMLFASGSYNWSSDETQIHQDYWSSDLILSWNAFSGLAITADERKLKEQMKALESRCRYAAEGVKLAVRSAYASYLNAKKSNEVAVKRVESALERLRIVRAQFEAGVVDVTDLVDAETEAFISESNLVISKTEIYNALVELEYAISAPIGEYYAE